MITRFLKKNKYSILIVIWIFIFWELLISIPIWIICSQNQTDFWPQFGNATLMSLFIGTIIAIGFGGLVYLINKDIKNKE